MGSVVFVLLLAVAAFVVVRVIKGNKRREIEKAERELAPVKQLAFEDVTALGEELGLLDIELAGRAMEPGENADYQRALDSYEAAKKAGDAMAVPNDVKHVTEILEDGRYALDCVRARVYGKPLPIRRAPCFFDPRHGTSIEDVPYTPPGGTLRDVPACALDAERVHAGAEPDIRKVMVGSRRVPYFQGGRAYQPYAQGYYGGFGMMDMMFMGMLFGGGFNGLGEGIGAIGEGIGGGLEGIGDGIGGLFDGIGGMFDGIGDMFDGFDF